MVMTGGWFIIVIPTLHQTKKEEDPIWLRVSQELPQEAQGCWEGPGLSFSSIQPQILWGSQNRSSETAVHSCAQLRTAAQPDNHSTNSWQVVQPCVPSTSISSKRSSISSKPQINGLVEGKKSSENLFFHVSTPVSMVSRWFPFIRFWAQITTCEQSIYIYICSFLHLHRLGDFAKAQKFKSFIFSSANSKTFQRSACCFQPNKNISLPVHWMPPNKPQKIDAYRETVATWWPVGF